MKLTLDQVEEILSDVEDYYSYDNVTSGQVVSEAIERIREAEEKA